MEEIELIKWQGNFKKKALIIVIISIVLTIICFSVEPISDMYHEHKEKLAEMHKKDLYKIYSEKADIVDEKWQISNELYKEIINKYDVKNSEEYKNAVKERDDAYDVWEKSIKAEDLKIYNDKIWIVKGIEYRLEEEKIDDLNNNTEYQTALKEEKIASEESSSAYEIYKNYSDYVPYPFWNEYFTIAGYFLIGFTVLTYLFYLYISKMEITVTNTRVYGKKAFGKRVDLPLDTISLVGTSFLKGIFVGTSSGRIHFKGITNNEEIHTEISKLLNARQSVKEKSADSNIEVLKKYKELLEYGIITQEEFDIKKKELLK